MRHASEVNGLSNARRQSGQVHERDAQVVDQVLGVRVRLSSHGSRLHVHELYPGQQVVRLAADELEDQVPRAVADILQHLFFVFRSEGGPAKKWKESMYRAVHRGERKERSEVMTSRHPGSDWLTDSSLPEHRNEFEKTCHATDKWMAYLTTQRA